MLYCGDPAVSGLQDLPLYLLLQIKDRVDVGVGRPSHKPRSGPGQLHGRSAGSPCPNHQGGELTVFEPQISLDGEEWVPLSCHLFLFCQNSGYSEEPRLQKEPDLLWDVEWRISFEALSLCLFPPVYNLEVFSMALQLGKVC